MNQKLNRIECDPSCGFIIQSHDEKEALDIAQDHVKNKHHMETSEEDMRSRMVVI